MLPARATSSVVDSPATLRVAMRAGEALRARRLNRATFLPLFLWKEGVATLSLASPSRAISSVVERLLHTQEVAGSNPASRSDLRSLYVLHLRAEVRRW